MSITDIRDEDTAAEPDDAAVWFDALAHTLTTDGDWPRCADCGEPAPGPHGHETCRPEHLAADADGPVAFGRGVRPR